MEGTIHLTHNKIYKIETTLWNFMLTNQPILFKINFFTMSV